MENIKNIKKYIKKYKKIIKNSEKDTQIHVSLANGNEYSPQWENNMADNVRERLEKRQEERLLELDRRRQERAEQTRPEETPVSLISTFVKEKEAIEKMLSDLTGLEKNVLRERFNELTRKSQLLQKFLSDSHAFLPSYDAKQLQQQSSKLEQDINEKRSHYLPKKKFAFSKKKQAIGGNDLAKKCVEVNMKYLYK